MAALLYTATLLVAAGLVWGFMREQFDNVAPPPPGASKPKSYEPPPKAVYDILAEQTLQRVEERRRGQVPDTGQRRRRTDHVG